MSTANGTRLVVHVPCDTFSVRVRVGFGEVLSPIEATVLRLIDALERDRAGAPGATSAEELVELLGLGHRVTLELLHDVWRKGYVRFDFGTGAVLVTDEVRTRIQQGTLHDLPGAEMSDYVCELMIDRLTGLVLPRRGSRSPADGRLAMSPDFDATTPATVPRAELVPALQRDLRHRFTQRGEDGADDVTETAAHREPDGRRPRVLAYRTPAADAQQVSERRWIPLEVQAHTDPDTGRLLVTVADRYYPADRHQSAGERLTQLVADNPSGTFARALRGAAGHDPVDPPPLERLLARLDEHAARVAGAPAGVRHARHLELCDEARAAGAALDNRTVSEVRAAPVSADDHDARIGELVAGSGRQLVLASPRITVSGWRRWEPELRRALDRQVHVLLLWGEAPGAALPDPVRNALNSLARRYGTRLLLPGVAACPGVNAVICDDRAALVTNRDFLGHPGTHSLGVRVEGSDPDTGCTTVHRLLAWAARTVPSGQMSRLVLTTAEDFGSPTAQPPAAPALPEPPPGAADAPAAAVRAWADAWVAHAARLSELAAARELPSARVVESGAHTDLLWRALRSAERRLVVSGDRPVPAAVHERFVALLERRLRAGVWVTLGLATPRGPDGEETSPAAALRRLAAEHPGRLRLVPARGRVLVHDDEAVIGGYDFLADGGRGGRGVRHRSELGIALAGAAAAEVVAAAVGEPPEVAAAIRRQGPAGTGATLTDPEVVYTRQRIVNRYHADPAGVALLRDELRRAPDPWAVLADLAEAAEPDLVAAAVARCLLEHGAAASPERSAHWRLRLMQLCWGTGDFVRAAILRRTLGDPGIRPRLPLAAIGGARHSDRLGPHLLEVLAETDPDAAEQPVLLLVAAEELVRSGDPDAADVVGELAATLGEPWEALGTAVRLCWKELYQRPAAPEVARALSADRRKEDTDQRWQRLEQALLLADRPPVNIRVAIRTHHRLFRDDSVFGRMLTLARRRDETGLRALLEKEFAADGPADGREAVSTLVDTVWRGFAQARAEPLSGGPRDKYLSRLAEVVDAARELAVPADGGGAAAPGHGAADPADVVRTLGRSLVGLRPRLEEAVGGLPEIERGLADAVLTDLRDLFALGAADDPDPDRGELG